MALIQQKLKTLKMTHIYIRETERERQTDRHIDTSSIHYADSSYKQKTTRKESVPFILRFKFLDPSSSLNLQSQHVRGWGRIALNLKQTRAAQPSPGQHQAYTASSLHVYSKQQRSQHSSEASWISPWTKYAEMSISDHSDPHIPATQTQHLG